MRGSCRVPSRHVGGKLKGLWSSGEKEKWEAAIMTESNLFFHLLKFILNVVEHSKWQSRVYVCQQALKSPWWRRRSEVVTKETRHFRTYCTESHKRCASWPIEAQLKIVVLSNAQCQAMSTPLLSTTDVRSALNEHIHLKLVDFSKTARFAPLSLFFKVFRSQMKMIGEVPRWD